MASSAQVRNRDWWHEFFAAFRPAFGIVTRRMTNAQVNYAVEKLNLRKGRRFLDCPCGIGRIALPLARRGVRVTGVDITQPYLDECARKAHRQGTKITLVRADMRRIRFENEFDAAANFWTSFGYFEKPSDNSLVLRRVFRALKPGGRFLLHLINRDWIMANYSPSEWFEIGDVRILERRFFDYATSISNSEWIFVRGKTEDLYTSSIRMYSYHELIGMFERTGFEDIQGFGSEKDEPISRDSQMMYILGRKPR